MSTHLPVTDALHESFGGKFSATAVSNTRTRPDLDNRTCFGGSSGRHVPWPLDRRDEDQLRDLQSQPVQERHHCLETENRMTDTLDVLAVVGSLRRQSLTRALVRVLSSLSPPSMKIEIGEIGALALYNDDLEREPPAGWRTWRSRVKRADAILLATPEYNRSVPACLKNAIDVASRPYGQSAWAGKPAAVISASPGAMGAFGANHHLRQSLVCLDMPTMQQPEAYVGHVDKLTADAQVGTLDPETQRFLTHFLTSFETWARTRRRDVISGRVSAAPQQPGNHALAG